MPWTPKEIWSSLIEKSRFLKSMLVNISKMSHRSMVTRLPIESLVNNKMALRVTRISCRRSSHSRRVWFLILRIWSRCLREVSTLPRIKSANSNIITTNWRTSTNPWCSRRMIMPSRSRRLLLTVSSRISAKCMNKEIWTAKNWQLSRTLIEEPKRIKVLKHLGSAKSTYKMTRNQKSE